MQTIPGTFGKINRSYPQLLITSLVYFQAPAWMLQHSHSLALLSLLLRISYVKK